MSYAMLFKGSLILGDLVTSEVQESIDDLGADTPVNQVFILFPRRPFEIKVLVV